MTNYDRIAKAIEYIAANYKQQPDLNKVAEKVHLSPFHFQRLFKEWAGVSPKVFVQYLTIEYAKKLLKTRQTTLSEAAFETGLSGTGRLHDLFVKIEGMTPGEYKNGGKELSIKYSFSESPFGNLIVASTSKGVCHIAFADNEEEAEEKLKAKFPSAKYDRSIDLLQQNAINVFKGDWNNLTEIKLHLKGTAFQIKVWEALLKIPMGQLCTYSQIAGKINFPKASRAVGTAIGENPVAFLIPCHRVIKSTGEIGQYHWGSHRKTAIIGWEAAKSINDLPL